MCTGVESKPLVRLTRGVVLDPSIITSVEKIEEQENEHTKTIETNY